MERTPFSLYNGERKANKRSKAMATMNLQDRAEYLSLALFSQGIVSVLIDYVDENKTRRLKELLRDALQSLRQTEGTPLPTHQRAVAFTTYEHLRTLEEVWSNDDRANAIKKIRRVLRAPNSPATKPVANELIDLFSKLQVQALWNFEQPRPVAPDVMQRLCKLA
jgi:hypothetical protein